MRCVEKIKITRLRIDSRTVTRGKHALQYGDLVPLVSSNVEVLLVVSGGKVKTFMKKFVKS
jgi:hypothetical protein